MSQSYFSADFFTASDRFRTFVANTGGRLVTIPLDAKGRRGEPLAIQVASFGPANARRALVHCSGVHGLEGFAGSAIQLQLLDEFPAIPNDTTIVLTHILNPYGMACLRRVNENNVDLNRNFIFEDEYAGATVEYAKLNSFLNPNTPPKSDLFLVRAAALVVRYGMAALRQAVLVGQYEYPKGLFFGGKQLEQGPREYKALLAEWLSSSEEIVVIDVHTGLGKYAEDKLLVDDSQYETLHRFFGEYVTQSDPTQGPAYRIRGGLSSLFSHLKPKAQISFLTQEFGTYGPLKVLHALREENRWHHYGMGSLDHPTKTALKAVFCPDDESWRNAVLVRGREVVMQALALLVGK